MANSTPLTADEKLQIVDALKKGNLSHREIAKRFGRAQSTISMLARDAGVSPTHRRRRTAAARDVEGTYSREQRVAVADKALSALEELISSGGLNPREMKEATQALKATLDARRAEDYPELETSGKQKSEEPYQLFDERGLPKNLGIVFNALDIQTAKEEADEEKAQEAGERLLRACEQEGVDPTEVDWSSLHDWRVPYAGYDSSVGEG